MKKRQIRNTVPPLLFSLFCCVTYAFAAEQEITPFSTSNQSPLVQIYGLPHDTTADIIPAGTFHTRLTQDLSSNYTINSNLHEQVILDGDTSRTTFTIRYGVSPRWEAGIEIPYILYGGGFLDSFIVDWHSTFGLPQGGRDKAPKNRVNYSYRKDGVEKFRMDRSASGIGDISLTGGVRLYESAAAARHYKLALKGAVKLPTGDSTHLFGSGSTDGMLLLCGSSNNFSEWWTLGVYGSVGVLAMTRSDVLRDQHNPFAGVGTLGVGWGPASWISFKAQLNGTTPLYRSSSLTEISKSPVLLIFGGALRFPGEYLLDIGVSEDIVVDSAPDVSFHLGLSKSF